MASWSIGVLCYNEAGSLQHVVEQLREVMYKIANTFEIIIIEDCNTDGSGAIALKLQRQYPEIKAMIHEKYRGIGEALRSTYHNAKYENVAFIPGDGQFDVTEYLPCPDLPEGYFVSFYRKDNIPARSGASVYIACYGCKAYSEAVPQLMAPGK